MPPTSTPSPLDMSAQEIADQYISTIQALMADRATMSPRKRLETAEEFVQMAERHIATGGLLQLRIASMHILAATLMGARD